MRWIESQTVWYGLVQAISNGSKHFIRENAEGTVKIEGFGMGGYGQGPFGMSYLAIQVSETRPQRTCRLPICLRSLFASGETSSATMGHTSHCPKERRSSRNLSV